MKITLTDAERKLLEIYNPQAMSFLFAVMNDEEVSMELRIEAARILACEATVPNPEADDA
jgi:hypothetical protein